MSGNEPNSRGIKRRSGRRRPANQQGNLRYSQKIKQPTQAQTYEKPNNINRYSQYRCGPGINIRMRDYWHRRGCSKPAGSSRCPNRWSTRPAANTGTVSLPYNGDRRTEPHRSSAVRWIWANGHGGPGRLVGNVKKLLTLTPVAIAMAALALMSACQTVATNNAELAASKKEFLLAQSGFKVITVTTPKQQQAISGLAQYRVSAVKYNGKLYYVFPTATKDKIYVGRQKQYNAYKGALQARLANHPAAQQAQPGQQLMNPAPTMTYETAGPQHIEVDQFDGFGPMGTASLGDW